MKKEFFIRKIIFLLIISTYCNITFGQGLSISGTITDKANNQPIPGVTILIKGTTRGIITDINGKYTIKAENNEVLVFSFIGYLPQEETVNGRVIIDIALSEESKQIDELIVIGYGTQKKSDKTGAVSHLTSEEMVTGAISDPIQSVQGKISGVSISKKGGDPNAGFAVTIRGAISMVGSTDPLYVIDGIPGADATTIASEDIESFNVLKDASSTAIYGSRGSNGVIIITTKKGKSKAGSVVEVNSYVSIDQVAKRLDLMTAADWRRYATENSLTLNDGGANTNWQDAIFRTGVSHTNNIAVSGGNEYSNYRVSITESDLPGVIIGTDKSRTIGRIDLTQKALDNKLTVTSSLSGTVEGNSYVSYDGNGLNDVLYQTYQRNPTDPIYNTDGSFYELQRDFNYWNPVAIVKKIQNTRDAKRYMGNIKADLELYKGLIASVNLGYIRSDNENFYFEPTTLASSPLGKAKRSYDNYYSKILETTVAYANKFADYHNLNIIGGYSFQQEGTDGFAAQGTGPTSNFLKSNNLKSLTVVIPGTDIWSYKKEGRLVSFFGRISYDYMSKYFLSTSIRRDGSSKFGANKKWGLFPAVSAGWTLKEESFLKDIDLISALKLRIGYGLSGNQGIDYNLAVRNAYIKGPGINPETGESSISYVYGYNNNPDLQWEVTSELNIGVDFGLFDNKISGSIEYYDKKTDKLLYEYSVPVPPNAERTQWANVGKIGNKGVEISLQSFLISQKDISWKTSLTYTLNRQNVISLSGGDYQWTPQHVGWLSGRGLVGSENWTQIVAPGYEIGTFFMPEYAGLNSQGKFLFYTAAGGVTSNVSMAERRVVGHAMPRWIAGWSNYFTINKNWDASITIRAVYGNDVLNVTRLALGNPTLLNNLSSNLLTDALSEKSKGITSPPTVNSYYLEDGSFIRIDNISIGHNFTWVKSKWIKGLRVYFTANNLYTFTKYSGVDPEASYKGLSFGLDQYNTYPKTRSYTFGINYKF